MIKPLKNEKWKVINFSKGIFRCEYAVSDHGRLVSYTSSIQDGNLLKGTLMGGYPTLKLKPEGRNMTLFIHRLVAEAFIPKRSEKYEFVIHLNYNKEDNHVRNLRWSTKEDMEKHQQKSPAVLAYRSVNRKKGHKLTDVVVKKIKQMINDKKRVKTMKQIADHFDISEMQLYRIKSGENWGHVKA
ncbi:MAG: HNH endonuclease [Bacteroidetes bacterium]|jgi:hypothetical protein|nr:HNH endonuclease [Bacteroidota bacterium]